MDRAKDAVAAMIKRLAHRNANVQLYTLEVCFQDYIVAKCSTDGADAARQCTITELRSPDAQGTVVAEFYRSYVEAGRGQSA
jgi:hypothetical protein